MTATTLIANKENVSKSFSEALDYYLEGACYYAGRHVDTVQSKVNMATTEVSQMYGVSESCVRILCKDIFNGLISSAEKEDADYAQKKHQREEAMSPFEKDVRNARKEICSLVWSMRGSKMGMTNEVCPLVQLIRIGKLFEKNDKVTAILDKALRSIQDCTSDKQRETVLKAASKKLKELI